MELQGVKRRSRGFQEHSRSVLGTLRGLHERSMGFRGFQRHSRSVPKGLRILRSVPQIFNWFLKHIRASGCFKDVLGSLKGFQRRSMVIKRCSKGIPRSFRVVPGGVLGGFKRFQGRSKGCIPDIT